MSSPHVFLLLALATASHAAITQFTWKDCDSSDPNRALVISEVTADPMPLVTPGPLHLHIKAKVTKDIKDFSIRLDLNRHTFLHPIHVPCVSNFGSCTFGCNILDEMITSGGGTGNVATQIEAMMAAANFPKGCVVPANTPLEVATYTINVPELGTAADVLADGDYTVTAKAISSGGELLGCLEFDASLTRKCAGWLCHSRRRSQIKAKGN